MSDPKKNLRVVTLSLMPIGDSYTSQDLADVVSELEAAVDDGEDREYTVRFHEMTADEYDALPEFEGF